MLETKRLGLSPVVQYCRKKNPMINNYRGEEFNLEYLDKEH